jgi:hypothetical protein
VTCTPDCYDRECGQDGCDGFCGTCTDDKSCDVMSGRCVGGTEGLVTGRLQYEYREGLVGWDGGVTLSDLRILPATNVWAYVADAASGEVLGARMVLGADGSFAVPISRAVQGNEKIVFATLWSEPPVNDVLLGVLRRDAGWGNYDPEEPLPPWTWTKTVPRSGDAGTITIEEGDGSGAMFIFLMNRRAQASVLDSVLSGDDQNLIRLGILWAPGAYGICGACYSSDTTPLIQGGPPLRQAIFIDDEPGGPSAWRFPVLLHEFGHYVAQNYSRDNTPGGPHTIGERLPPAFAWSEGWASFFGAMTATRWFGFPQPVYWDIQGGGTFWIDYDTGGLWNEKSIGLPVRAAGMNQNLDESFVTMALWRLWTERGGGSAQGDGLTANAILKAISSARFVDRDREAPGSDLVDFLDAATCGDSRQIGVVKALCDGDLHFPWDGDPLCMGQQSSAVRGRLLDDRRASPLAPLSVDLVVKERGAVLDVHARALVRGRIPGPVHLVVRWPDPTAVGGEVVASADGPADGALPEVHVQVPAGARPIRVDATSRGPDSGASAHAAWPPAVPAASRIPVWHPIPAVKIPGATLTTAVSLDRE